ncbi:peripherin-2-like isoform X2 [Centruroides sculpturatus]|uniref:peripherin-2-like isoform X2 n=1 Tax=Centruroides sculpturatus TaxID=218467 RepID=UPI000C6DAF79|nr:peripherin-2-like isoform X2 [Centruroides sculpturatus]
MNLITRYSLTSLLFTSNVLILLFALCFLMCGLYTELVFDFSSTFINRFYDFKLLSLLFSWIGILLIIVFMYGLIVFIMSTRNDDLHYKKVAKEKRIQAERFLFSYIFVELTVFLFLPGGVIYCFNDINLVESRFEAALRYGMKYYKKDRNLKFQIQYIQRIYDCCGSKDFTGWFRVSWMSSKYVDTDRPNTSKALFKNSDYYLDDVPISCCNIYSKKPCFNQFINTEIAQNYSLVINQIGCKEVLTN